MTSQRVAILDASHSVFEQDSSLPKGKAKAQSNHDNGFLLQPIPGLQDILSEVLKDDFRGDVWAVEVGAMCRIDAVRRVGKALHQRILTSFKETRGQ